jgi:hypothetical protein
MKRRRYESYRSRLLVRILAVVLQSQRMWSSRPNQSVRRHERLSFGLSAQRTSSASDVVRSTCPRIHTILVAVHGVHGECGDSS